MTFKKRAVFSLLTICLIAVICVMSVVVVFAIDKVTVTTSVSVTYTSSVIGGSYSFAYKNAKDEDYTYICQDVPFSVSASNSAEAYNVDGITDQEVQLNYDENPYFILRWDIRNTSANTIYPKLNYVDTGDADSGIIRKCASSNVSNLTSLPVVADSAINSTILNGDALGSYNHNSYSIRAKCTWSHFIKVTLSDKYTNALYDGDFTWTIEGSVASE